jgi:hypothetical protein
MGANNTPIAEALHTLEAASVHIVQVPGHGVFDFKWASDQYSTVLDNKIGGVGPCKVVFIYEPEY